MASTCWEEKPLGKGALRAGAQTLWKEQDQQPEPLGKIFHLGDQTLLPCALPGRLQGSLTPAFFSSSCCQAALSVPWGQEAGATFLLGSASSKGSSTSQLRAWNYPTWGNHNLQVFGTGILQQAQVLPPP